MKNKAFNRVYLHLRYRLEYLFLALILPVVIIFIAIIPPSWGLDEQVHTARVYQITENGMYPAKLPSAHAYGGYISGNLKKVIDNGWETGNNLSKADPERQEPFYAAGRKDVRYDTQLNSLGKQSINGGGKATYYFGATAPYTPLVYIPAAVGMEVGKIFNTSVNTSLILAKLGQTVLYTGCVFAALKVLNKSRAKWVIFCVALFPETVFQVATINADVYTNGVVLLFAAVIVRLFNATVLTRRLNVLLWASSIALMFTKPSYALAIVLVVLLPLALYENKKQMWKHKTILLLVCAAIFIVVSVKGLQYSDAILMYFSASDAANISLAGQLGFILHHPFSFVVTLLRTMVVNTYDWQSGMLGVFGYDVVAVPYALTLPLIFSTLIAALYSHNLTRLKAWALIGVGVLSGLTVILLLYGTFNTIGASVVAGVQGRYYIPSLVFVLLGLASAIGIHVTALKSDRTLPRLIVAGVAFTLLSSVVVYGMALF